MIKMIQNSWFKLMNKYKFIQQPTPVEMNEIINGAYTIDHAMIDRRIKVNGQAILGEEVLVKEKIVINGSLIATHVNFESYLEVNGTVSLVDSTVKGKAIFSGTLNAKKSNFTNSIYLLASKSDFEYCRIDNLTILALPSKIPVQKIRLTKGTIVAGEILFESGIGEVHLDATCTIKGRIIGGILIYESK